MKIQLIDRKQALIDAFKKAFEGCDDVEVFQGNIFDIKTDCIVSPANSYGFMDGSLELAISNTLGWGIQTRLQKLIQEEYNGELLVGQATLIITDKPELIPFCLVSPTMRVPSIIKNTPNPYLAAKALFVLLKDAEYLQKRNQWAPSYKLESVSIPGLGTGVGNVNYEVCAKQIRLAYDDFWLGKYKFPTSWREAQNRHQLLYGNTTRDLQF